MQSKDRSIYLSQIKLFWGGFAAMFYIESDAVWYECGLVVKITEGNKTSHTKRTTELRSAACLQEMKSQVLWIQNFNCLHIGNVSLAIPEDLNWTSVDVTADQINLKFDFIYRDFGEREIKTCIWHITVNKFIDKGNI